MGTFFLETLENLRIALRAVGTHKLRAVLTTLGIIIGIIAVTVMATVINGVEADFDEEMSSLGVDVIYVQRMPWMQGPGTNWWELINRPRIEAEYAETINIRSRHAVAAVPLVETRRTARYREYDVERVSIEGSTPDYPRVLEVQLAVGRFYNDIDNRSARNVCVIGANVANGLFPAQQPLGKMIRISGHRFQVIGVLERQGSGAEGGSSEDNQIKVPIESFRSTFGTRRRDVTIVVKAGGIENLEATKDEVTGIMRVARGLDAREDDDFEINDQQSLREQLAPVKLAIYGIGIFLTSLSLLVGGIGVMNIMFVSVKERTREIGIRKAVGAKRRAILTQFLVESVIVCLIGGVIGVLVSLGITGLIRMMLPAVLPMSTVMLAFGICLAVGVAFGLAPAWTAAKAEPIDALRYE